MFSVCTKLFSEIFSFRRAKHLACYCRPDFRKVWGFRCTVFYFCRILSKNVTHQQIVVKLPKNIFHKNTFSGIRIVVTCAQSSAQSHRYGKVNRHVSTTFSSEQPKIYDVSLSIGLIYCLTHPTDAAVQKSCRRTEPALAGNTKL